MKNIDMNPDTTLVESLGVSSPSDKVVMTASQLLAYIRKEREACAELAKNKEDAEAIRSRNTVVKL
jgi:hypothetical protein